MILESVLDKQKIPSITNFFGSYPTLLGKLANGARKVKMLLSNRHNYLEGIRGGGVDNTIGAVV